MSHPFKVQTFIEQLLYAKTHAVLSWGRRKYISIEFYEPGPVDTLKKKRKKKKTFLLPLMELSLFQKMPFLKALSPSEHMNTGKGEA